MTITLGHELATVYLYIFWDENTSVFITAKREATLDCIRCGLGIPLLTSGRQVALSHLDDVGRLTLITQEDGWVAKA